MATRTTRKTPITRHGPQTYTYPSAPPAHLDTSQDPDTQNLGTFPKLVGVDGRYTGRLKRFPGFYHHTTLAYAADDTGLAYNVQWGGGNSDIRDVFEYFAIQKDIKSDGVLRGFLYLATKITTLDKDHLMAKWYDSKTESWDAASIDLLATGGWLVSTLDVTYDSRHIYAIGTKDRDPEDTIFRPHTDGTLRVFDANHGLEVGDPISFAEQGTLPSELAEDTLYYVISTATTSFVISAVRGGTGINYSQTFTNTAADPGVITANGHGYSDNDIVYFNSSDTLPDPLSVTTAYYVVNKTDNTFEIELSIGGGAIELTDTGTGTHYVHSDDGTHTIVYGTKKINRVYRYATVEPVADFTKATQVVATPEWRGHAIEPGTRADAPAVQVGGASHYLSAGEYVFAWRMYAPDQRWYGPVSQFAIDTASAEDFATVDAWDGSATVPVLLPGSEAETMFLSDPDRFFTRVVLQLLRSTAGNASVNGSTPGTLYVEREIECYHLDDDDDRDDVDEDGWFPTPDVFSSEGIIYWGSATYEGLTDSALTLQKDLDPEEVVIYTKSDESGGEPPASLVQEYEDLLFRVSAPMPDDEAVDLDVTRWGSTNLDRHNLLPITNRRIPKGFSSTVEELLLAEPYLLLVETNRIVRIHRSGSRLAVETIHNQHGVSAKEACIAVGTHAFMISPPGLLLVDLTTQSLDAVQAAQRIILTDWKDSLADVQTCYDSQLGAIFFHNPTEEETLVVWMATGIMSTLEDMIFAKCTSGPHPENGGTSRSFWVSTDHGDIYVVDIELNNPYTMKARLVQDAEIPHWNYIVDAVSGNGISIDVSGDYEPIVGLYSDEPFYIYMLDGVAKGNRYRCTGFGSGGSMSLTPTGVEIDGVEVGDRISLGPVPFKVTHWPLSGSPTEYVHDPYHTKKVHTTMAAISNLDAPTDGEAQELRCSLHDKNLAEIANSVGYLPMSETPGEQVYTPGEGHATYLPRVEQYNSGMGFELSGLIVLRTLEVGLSAKSSI